MLHSLVIFFCSLLHVVHNQVELELPLFSVQSLSLLVQFPKPLLVFLERELCFCQPFFKFVAVRRPGGRSNSFLEALDYIYPKRPSRDSRHVTIFPS